MDLLNKKVPRRVEAKKQESPISWRVSCVTRIVEWRSLRLWALQWFLREPKSDKAFEAMSERTRKIPATGRRL